MHKIFTQILPFLCVKVLRYYRILLFEYDRVVNIAEGYKGNWSLVCKWSAVSFKDMKDKRAPPCETPELPVVTLLHHNSGI